MGFPGSHSAYSCWLLSQLFTFVCLSYVVLVYCSMGVYSLIVLIALIGLFVMINQPRCVLSG